ncbi:hypothetical protein [Sphingomonas sp. LaA6.9]|uniref:hypothetical protein n=1 Tax=Sphingomonas sp. LaA6.9 TaxID=2919914 RepID=UPI001F4F62A8|nr:hypothetical protein [Sphingomonas sp. LaA6.9]MCJ8156904.1 hypothetical protein [Sphingomonas sp. LaA6.9]
MIRHLRRFAVDAASHAPDRIRPDGCIAIIRHIRTEVKGVWHFLIDGLVPSAISAKDWSDTDRKGLPRDRRDDRPGTKKSVGGQTG